MTAERVFEVDTKVDRIVDPLVRWPRAALLLGVAFLIATAIWGCERTRGRLLPVYGAGEPGDPEIDADDRVLVDA